jgi:hypothetical protein
MIILISGRSFWCIIGVNLHQLPPFAADAWKIWPMRTAEGSMFFTFRELGAVALTGADNYLLDVLKDENGKWVIQATIVDGQRQAQQSYMVQTNRGKTKTWRYLEDALGFVAENCGNCRNLAITVGGRIWRLSAEAMDDQRRH